MQHGHLGTRPDVLGLDGRQAGRLAHSLRTLRDRRGLSLGNLARAAGVSPATLSGLEAGRGNPTMATLLNVARALGVPASRLLSEDEDEPPGA